MPKKLPTAKPTPEKPPPPPPSKWRVTLAADAAPLDVLATSAVISTAGVLLFKGGPDGNQLLRALAAGEWRSAELIGDPLGNAMVAERRMGELLDEERGRR
jgi:hypothetical protein